MGIPHHAIWVRKPANAPHIELGLVADPATGRESEVWTDGIGAVGATILLPEGHDALAVDLAQELCETIARFLCDHGIMPESAIRDAEERNQA